MDTSENPCPISPKTCGTVSSDSDRFTSVRVKRLWVDKGRRNGGGRNYYQKTHNSLREFTNTKAKG